MKTIFLMLTTLLFTANLFASEPIKTNPKTDSTKKEVANKVIAIDVRSVMELKANPAPGAIHIPVSNIKNEITSKVPDKNTKVILFCESGRRAGAALEALKSMGYKNVKNLGSWRDWNASQKVKGASK